MMGGEKMKSINWKREIMVLLERVNDEKVLRRVWKILMSVVIN